MVIDSLFTAERGYKCGRSEHIAVRYAISDLTNPGAIHVNDGQENRSTILIIRHDLIRDIRL